MVKKIFILLITVVALIAIGALVLNVLLPNGTSMLIDTIEGGIYSATGIDYDVNNNGVSGSQFRQGGTHTGRLDDDSSYTNDENGGGNVTGFN